MTACIGGPNDPGGAGLSSPSPSPSPSTETRHPHRDLLYVAASDLGTDRVVAIEMPEGKILHDLPATGLVRDGSGVSRPHVTSEFAFFSRTVLGDDIREFRTTVERIDLRTGERRSVEAGTVTFAGILAIGSHEAPEMSEAEKQAALRSYAEQVTRSYGSVAAAPDGSLVLLTRRTAGDKSTTRVDRFDGRSLAHLGTTTLSEDAPERLYAIDAERILSVRSVPGDESSAHVVWTLLDTELRPLATRTFSSSAGPGRCSPDLRVLRDGRTWVAACSNGLSRFLQLLDRDRLTDRGVVDIGGGPPNPWNIVAWEVTADGSILVMTGRPSVIRVDPASRQVVDHRLIAVGSSPRPRQEPIEIGPRSPAIFSADHRRVYVLYLGSDPGSTWRAPVSMVDLASGKVMAIALEGPGVSGIELSRDGTLLYAIQEGRVVTLDAGNLAMISATEALVTSPAWIVTVANRD